MSTGTQCDNCRVFAARDSGWLYVMQQPRADDDVPRSLVVALFGNPADPLTFCTVKCLSEWAYVRAAAESAAGPS